MTEQSLLTVIVPVYNIKEYLERCVLSIVNQTYSNLEILLVDDGSTDGTGDLCDTLAKQDSRIRVIHKENGGASSARNVGIREAKGTYFAFVDSDDYIESWMYQRMMEIVHQRGAKMVQVGRDEINLDGSKRPDICIPVETLSWQTREEFFIELLMHRGDCSFCTKVIQKELFSGLEFPEGALNEDFHLLIEMLPKVEGLYMLPGYGYHVFYRENSNSRRKDKKDFSRVYADSVDNADLIETLVRKEYPSLVEIAFRFAVFQRLEYLLHIPIEQMNKDNAYYGQVVSYLRRYWWKGVQNRYLTAKNKVYLLLFVLSPKGIRVLHRRLRGKALAG